MWIEADECVYQEGRDRYGESAQTIVFLQTGVKLRNVANEYGHVKKSTWLFRTWIEADKRNLGLQIRKQQE